MTELALACGVPKGTVHRLLDQLTGVGAVERAGNRYRVGPQLYRLGQAWEPHPGLRPAARLPLQRLRAATGASVVLVVLREETALTVGSVPGTWNPSSPYGTDSRSGSTPPPAEPAGAPEGRRRPRPGGRGGRVCCASLPVRAPDGRTVAALAAMVPAGRRLDALAHAVAGAGAAITRALAGGGRRRPLPSAALVP